MQRDREWSIDNNIGLRRSNPALRFQDGDILSDGSTPNLTGFYATGAGRFPYGFSIPDMQDFIDDYIVRPYEDGLVAGDYNQFGGDGVHAQGYDPDWLTPDDERITINLTGRYDLADDVTVFAEFNVVNSEIETFGVGTGFYDLLTISPDNPFIPPSLQPIAAASGGFRITRDPQDLGGSRDRVERDVSRFVIGLEGEFNHGRGYEFSLNRGQTDITQLNRGATIMDRYWAAIDVTTTEVHNYEIEQTVFSGILDGELGFRLDAGKVAFAAGAEFRTERSTSSFDAWRLPGNDTRLRRGPVGQGPAEFSSGVSGVRSGIPGQQLGGRLQRLGCIWRG